MHPARANCTPTDIAGEADVRMTWLIAVKAHKVSNRLQILSLVALCAILTGCSSYHLVSDRSDADPTSPGSSMADVVVGSHVRVTRLGGERVTGVVLEMVDGSMTVQRYASRGKGAIVVPVREISEIELRQSEPMPTLGIIAIAGASLTVAYYILLSLAILGAGGLD